MARRIVNQKSLLTWSVVELRERLDAEVARLNRRRRLGTVSEFQVSDLFGTEQICTWLGAEIRRRREMGAAQ